MVSVSPTDRLRFLAEEKKIKIRDDSGSGKVRNFVCEVGGAIGRQDTKRVLE